MTPGRCVCVAAGNAGQEAPQFAGDLGFLTGRIHASGQVPARGLETDLDWQVVGNGIADVSENELEIWYEPGDEFSKCALRSPSGVWIGPVGPGHLRREPAGSTSETFVSIYNERYNPANGANRISMFLSPRLKDRVVGIEAGTWIVRLRGIEVRDGRFDAWIERDDPRPLGRIGEVDAWRFPSYFIVAQQRRSFVGQLAGLRVPRHLRRQLRGSRPNGSTGPRARGPTRDGRYKPEIAAPGTDVVAARGFSSPDRPWVAMTGTSMASPYVAGVAAHDARARTAADGDTDRRHHAPNRAAAAWIDYTWQDAAGFGRIRPEACLAEVHKPFTPVDLDKNDMKLTVFHAADGDCLLLTSADNPRAPAPRRRRPPGLLRDQHARVLGQLRAAGEKLDVVCVSHIDDDHISGSCAWSRTKSSGARSSSPRRSMPTAKPPGLPGRRRSARSGTTACSGWSATRSGRQPRSCWRPWRPLLAGSPRGRAARPRLGARRPRDRRAVVDGIVAPPVGRTARHRAESADRRKAGEAQCLRAADGRGER